jgi:hypothetical protein
VDESPSRSRRSAAGAYTNQAADKQPKPNEPLQGGLLGELQIALPCASFSALSLPLSLLLSLRCRRHIVLTQWLSGCTRPNQWSINPPRRWVPSDPWGAPSSFLPLLFAITCAPLFSAASPSIPSIKLKHKQFTRTDTN